MDDQIQKAGGATGDATQLARFEQVVLPHLDAAYNLARWLTRNADDADDVVQEAYLRALQFFGGFRGVEARAWLLKIVRNTCYTWLQKNRAAEPTLSFDEGQHGVASQELNPEALLKQSENKELLNQALESLPIEFREVIVLRELEGLSYRQIADIVAIPLGTVMSRLARARERLHHSLAKHLDEGP